MKKVQKMKKFKKWKILDQFQFRIFEQNNENDKQKEKN